MRSSGGKYYVGLDHIRAIAAFLVFVWHFNHVQGGASAAPLILPLSVMTEGHVGVALFMCLSGYLFAKLLEGKKILYWPFMWNRMVRLFPLLIVVFVLAGVNFIYFIDLPLRSYLRNILFGFLLPTWPNGGWSIAVELHFYILLPALLLLSARKPALILLAIMCSIAFRLTYWSFAGQVQMLAYWTIIGCIDYFVFGIFAYRYRSHVRNNHVLAAGLTSAFILFIYYFDSQGGFYNNRGYPSPSPVWIVFPTIVGSLMSFLIAWYDTSFQFEARRISGFLARIGECSYSIYLLHFFVVFRIGSYIDEHVVSLENDYLALVFAAISFLIFLPVARLSFKYIELPALHYRLPYVAGREPRSAGGTSDAPA